MALLGDSHRVDYLGLYIVVLVFTDVHRHYGLPQVYLDREVFRRHPLRFTVFPALMFGLFASSPWLRRSGWTLTAADLAAVVIWTTCVVQVLARDLPTKPSTKRPLARASAAAGVAALLTAAVASASELPLIWSSITAGITMSLGFAIASWLDRGGPPARDSGIADASARPSLLAPAVAFASVAIAFIPMRSVPMNRALSAIAVIAGAWNIWHVFMQKYGVLRLYASKRESVVRVPGWVDRLLVFSWLPLIVVTIGTQYQTTLFRMFPSGRTLLGPVVDLLALWGPLIHTPLIVLVVAALAIFVGYEWKVGERNAPRLTMAAGITLLSASFFFLHPLKAYLAYAFSHAVEYMVFIWAVQRRRYAQPLDHQPLMARALRHPWIAYIATSAVLGTLFIYWKYVGRGILPDVERPSFLGHSALEWVGYWTVYQSMVHFYFDGFMWKMRDPAMKRLIRGR